MKLICKNKQGCDKVEGIFLIPVLAIPITVDLTLASTYHSWKWGILIVT